MVIYEFLGNVEVADIADARNDDFVVIVPSELLENRSVSPAVTSIRGPEPKQQRPLTVWKRAQVDRLAGGHLDHVEIEDVR